MAPGTVACADSRYPTIRHSSHCTFDIMNNATGKVLSLGTVDKNSLFYPKEIFKYSSNMMETEASRRALASFESFENVTSIVIEGYKTKK